MRLMSAWAIAMSAAINAVITPIHTTTISDAVTPLIAPSEKIGYTRATRNTPAATIVAAWIKALTGVGPSIAGGNQTCSGNWADFPIAPQKTRIIARVSNPLSILWTLVANWLNSNVPVLTNRIMIPMIKPTSPMRFTIKASMAALAG